MVHGEVVGLKNAELVVYLKEIVKIGWLTGWISGGALVSITEVSLHPAQLVMGRVTAFGRADRLGMLPSTQVIIHSLPIAFRVGAVSADSGFRHHTHTNVSRPFFQDQPGEPVPEENFWTLWCKGRLTEADTLTIRLGATTSGLSSVHL